MGRREDGGSGGGMIEGWWEYREKEEGGREGGITVGRMEEEQYVMRCFILIQRPVRGGRYLLIIVVLSNTKERKCECVFVYLQC